MWKLLIISLFFILFQFNHAEQPGEESVEGSPPVVEKTPADESETSPTEEPQAENITTTLTDAQKEELAKSGQTQEFQAEVSRLMEIIVNSLYKTRDIFARELISNANDAIDKIRYNSLTNPDVLKSNPKLEIKVQANKDAGTLTFFDTGIGMTAAELAKNLGTVAHSGTASFLDKFAEAKKEGGDPMSLIGQFGVGFYSAFLVSDSVTVISKSNDDAQHIWSSTANGSYTIIKDPRGNTLGRGTAVILQIKEDAQSFLEESELEKVITRYSEFIQYPIYLYSTKSEFVEVPVEEEPKKEDEDKEKEKEGDEDLEVKDADKEEKAKPKTKSVEKKTTFWNRLNANKPIWSRRPSQIKDEEYKKFYKALAKNEDDPLDYTHFRAEGEIEFNSILFIPKSAPFGMYEQYYNQKPEIKLYVRRVLVADKFENIVPRYLNFLKGLVDSDDLPLNVNREDLQKSKIVTLISRKLTRKALDMLKKMAAKSDEQKASKNETSTDEGEVEGEGEDEEKKKKKEEDKETDYDKFWKEFGKSVKLGYLEDNRNKKRLLELMRFPSSKNPNGTISLQDYVKNKKPGQKFIYTLSAGTVAEAEKSPFMERLRKKDLEVLYFVDNLDEYLNLQDYEDFEFKAITKDGTVIDNKKMEEFLKEKDKEFENFKLWLKKVLGDRISRAQVSTTLSESPMAIGTAKWGASARMQKIAGNQAFGSGGQAATKILQVNYRHPVILKMKKMVDDGEAENNKELEDQANLLLDVALIQSGFDIDSKEHVNLASRVHRIVKSALSISPEAKLLEEPDFVNEVEETPTDEGDDENEDDDEEEEGSGKEGEKKEEKKSEEGGEKTGEEKGEKVDL